VIGLGKVADMPGMRDTMKDDAKGIDGKKATGKITKVAGDGQGAIGGENDPSTKKLLCKGQLFSL
jgi:hypothetical protein